MSCLFGHFRESPATFALHPRTSSSSPAPCRVLHRHPRSRPLSLTLLFRLGVSLPSSAVIFVLLRATCLILSKGYTSVYLSISVCPVLSSRRVRPRGTRTESRVSGRPRAALPAFTLQVEQSISISRESLLNLEFAVSVSEEANGDARARAVRSSARGWNGDTVAGNGAT